MSITLMDTLYPGVSGSDAVGVIDGVGVEVDVGVGDVVVSALSEEVVPSLVLSVVEANAPKFKSK